MFPTLDLSHDRDPHARGSAYGRAAAAQIAHSLATYADLFGACGIAWDQAERRAGAYLSVVEALDADLVAELHGIAEGSGCSLAAILALNCRTEILPASYLNPAAPDASECTAMCVAAEAGAAGHAWFAQNWDWVGRQRAAMLILKTVDRAGRRITTLTEAGMLAKIGLNDAGFALGLNIVRSLQDGERPGLPVHVLLRHLLSCASVAAVRERLHALASLGFGSSSNVPCADALGEVACFEVAPKGWAELKPVNGTVVHTNHFLCDALAPHQAPIGAVISSAPRLATAARHAGRPTLGLAELQAFLRDESDGYLSICRSPDPLVPPASRMETVAGIVINPHTRQIWIAPDVPSRVAFTEVL